MFGLHMPELIIILAVALLIFGPKKLPEMGSAIGRSIKEFRKGMNELSQPKEDNEEVVQKVSPLETIERENSSKKGNIVLPVELTELPEREKVVSTEMRND